MRHERAHLIARAREIYGTDELEIDEDAKLSPSDAGTWVAAWVWLADEWQCGQSSPEPKQRPPHPDSVEAHIRDDR